MPELPEVETVCRQLEPELEGRRIEQLEVLDERWTRPVPAAEVERAVAGRTIEGLGRRGKYLLLELDRGQTLVMHLRMTGNLVLVEGEEVVDPSEGMRLYEGERSTSERHLRARFELDDGRELWFTDPRRFGEAFLIDDGGLEARFAKLGVEPLSADFTPEVLGERAAGRTAPL
jgi:formamidopyrimidine-DNA glycosylase